MTIAREHRSILTGIGIAVTILLLVTGALSAHRPVLVPLMITGVAGTVVAVARLLSGAAALVTTLATCIAIYTVAFAGGTIAIFHHAHWFGIVAGFLLPLLSFVAAVAWKKEVIQRQLTVRRRALRERVLVRGMGWLCLCFAFGILVVAIVPPSENVMPATLSLMGAMTLISASTVWFVADITALLNETGELFHRFLVRMKSRIVPIFSFLIVFLFIGVLFATIYALLDQYTAQPAFSMAGTTARLDLPDAIYFSFVTLSTIGYGDITPVDAIARVLVIAEIIFGVVLLLFAFAEIAAYNPDAEADDDGKADDVSSET